MDLKITDLIQKKDYRSLVKLLCDRTLILNINCNEIDSKFKPVLQQLAIFYNGPTENIAKKLISLAYGFTDVEDFLIFRFLFKIVIASGIYLDFTNNFTNFINKNVKYALFLFNCTFFMNLQHNRNIDLYDLSVMLKVKDIKNTDFYTYNFIKALILINRDDFSEAYKCMQISYKHKEIKTVIRNEYLIFSFFDPSAEYKDHINEKFIAQDQQISLNIIKTLQNGDIDSIYNYIPQDHILSRTYFTYLPLICIRNLILKFYNLYENHKIDLPEIIGAIQIDEDTFFLLILNCIDRGLIRGYLGLKKKILVLSKTLPFPNLIG
ncbi:hypothetical protein NUSPORA_00949 [Nucleospora cyclopteri]